MLCTMKSKSWEHSSNTNSCLMVAELETLLASQAIIMKYGSMDKFLSIELKAKIRLKRSYDNHDRIDGCLTEYVYCMISEFANDGVLCWLPPIYKDFVIGYSMQGESFTFHGLWTQTENCESCGDPRLAIRNTRYAYNSRSHDQCVVNPHIQVDNRIRSSITVPK
jgi:hypothetical protein